MAPPTAFLNYPEPTEGPKEKYVNRVDTNPALRDVPLWVASNLMVRAPFIAKYLWHNSGLGKTKDMAALLDIPPRFHPCVTPLGETGPMLAFEPELLSAKGAASGVQYYSAADYHEMYKSGKVTPLQVAQAILSATKSPAYEDAWADSHGADGLALQAAKESTQRYAEGKPLGVLDGVPIGVKDDTAVKGYINHFGLKYRGDLSFFKPSETSSWPVLKLQEAGAVVIGKNRMHEVGSDTNGCNVAQGTPTNHMNPLYYPGGSTSGGSSAVGAGVVPLVIGTDGGGSIRVPATFNGAYGLKPSHHRACFMDMTTCVTGPLASSAADLTIAYRVLSQPNPDDTWQRTFGLSIPPSPTAKRTMGIYRDWWASADPRVVETCDRAIAYFAERRGYEVIDISIPHISEGQAAHSAIIIAELLASVRRKAAPNPNNWHSIVSPPNKLLLSAAAQENAVEWLGSNRLRELLMRHLAFLFQSHPGLLIMTPTTSIIGWARQPADDAFGVSDTNKTVESMKFIFLANLTGIPAVSAPVGYVDPEQGEGRLAIGLQAMGEWGAEEQLLAWAREAEEYLHNEVEGGRRRPETWFDVFAAAKENKTY